jgi:hypothetical protein
MANNNFFLTKFDLVCLIFYKIHVKTTSKRQDIHNPIKFFSIPLISPSH